MSDTDNVAGDVNKPVNDETVVSQENLQGDNNASDALSVSDVLGQGPSAAEQSEKTAEEKQEDNQQHGPQAESTDSQPQAEPADSEETGTAGAEAAENADSVSKGSEQGEDKPESHGFDGLGLPERVLAAVKKVGYEQPSPIQAATIPVLMEGQDVVGLAQTGTGKTAAFALPVLSQIDPSRRHPQALVLAPTRELALQVAEAFQSFSEHLGGIHVLPIYGGQAYGVQLAGLRRGAHVVVGTPGRVIDHLEKGSLDISELRFMVLDEADEMLNMGFQEDVERILADTPDTKQVALFSATMPATIRRLSKQYLNDPQEITVKATQRTSENIEQDYLLVNHRNKLDALTRILEVTEFEAMIMFVRTKNETEELAERLRARGFNAAAINGDIAQAQRERTVDQLKDGRLDILVATDVAARGLDVDRITHVFNYDIPHDTESYVHRIGRTGRAGRSGRAILFVTPRERRLLKAIERATRSRLNEIELPTVDSVNEARKDKFREALTESLSDPQISVFRSLVKEYAQSNEVPLEDVAAALAAQLQSGEDFLMKEPPRQERRERRNRDDRYGDNNRSGGGAYRSHEERFGNRRAPRVTDRGGKELEVYRLAVGHRQRVRPGAIVGALANEGGLNSRDFGRISIFADHSLVELPADLPEEVFRALDQTRVSGQLINIEPDPGAPAGRPAHYRKDRDDRRGGRGGDRGGDRRGAGGGRYDRDDRGGQHRGGGDFRRGHRDDREGFERGGYDRGDRGGFRRNDRDNRGGGFNRRGGNRDGYRGGDR
ncbi:DEAD/DEAH box helicase [Corynebacterium heidelbergense]|uniref:ATP-dependent RNA helicase DeaD n=1 Tax=Corynebacterium heidelbergense TaxID=2055947 RepID=A0A364VDV7_9CORY|nr:DEAD/DEAH box helicase [Corynebacterium heidelbergense]RAV34842.1 ATP-dependent RNA helicase [Corynebacterium heidelbergense]WCZ36922.1 ATP-dependent RNA helicase DeaD [Corynebacterium heidelbergense]